MFFNQDREFAKFIAKVPEQIEYLFTTLYSPEQEKEKQKIWESCKNVMKIKACKKYIQEFASYLEKFDSDEQKSIINYIETDYLIEFEKPICDLLNQIFDKEYPFIGYLYAIYSYYDNYIFPRIFQEELTTDEINFLEAMFKQPVVTLCDNMLDRLKQKTGLDSFSQIFRLYCYYKYDRNAGALRIHEISQRKICQYILNKALILNNIINDNYKIDLCFNNKTEIIKQRYKKYYNTQKELQNILGIFL